MISRLLDVSTGLFDRFASSAVLLREASRTSRRWQTYASRVAFTGALFGVLLLGIYTAVNAPGSDAANMGWMGRAIFIAISSVLMLLALVLAPIITSGAIIEETEDRTLEMLVLSKLEPSQILAGKVLSRILILLTIVFGALPVMAMVVTLGGVAPQAVVAVTVHALLAVVLGGALGAFFGLFTKSPMLAMMATVCYALPTFWMLPAGYALSTGHPNDAVHFSLFAGPAAQDWTSPVAILSYLPSLAVIFVIGTRLFELRIAGADIKKAFSGETWGTKSFGIGIGVALASLLVLWVPVLGAYSLRFGASGWVRAVGLVGCVAVIWAWWTLTLTLSTWVMLRVGVDVVDALDAVLGGRGKRKRDRSDVRMWSNPVAWREARPAAWSANGGALLATWLLGLLGMFQTGWWLFPGGSLLMGVLNTLAAFGLTVWLAARSVEEERRNQSLEVLLTSTLSSWRIILGKSLGVFAPTVLLLLISLPFLSLGFPHLHMFDLGQGDIGALGWFVRGLLTWVWVVALWLVLLGGSLWIGLRVKRRRSGFAVAVGAFLTAVAVPGAIGRIFEDVWFVALPCQLVAPPLAGGASYPVFVVSIVAWGLLAVFLFGWTSFGLRRWISAGLGLLLAFGVSTAQAQQVQLQDGFLMAAEPLGEGIVRADHWAALRVKIVNQGRKATGQLTVVERSGTTSMTYSRPVELPQGARKDVVLLYRPNSSTRDRVVTLDTSTGRHAEAGFRLQQVSPDATSVGVFGIDMLGIQAIRQTVSTGVPGPRPRAYARDDRTVYPGLIEPGVLPNNAAGYAAFDQLVWPGADPSSLTPGQVTALLHWVADGGHLVLTVTENWQALEQSALEPLLPLDFRGTADSVRHASVQHALGIDRPGQGTLPVAVGRVRLDPGRRTFVRARTGDGTPAWVTQTFGLGTVSVLAFDPRSLPAAGTPDPESLWRRVLSLPLVAEALPIEEGATTLGGRIQLRSVAGHLDHALDRVSPTPASALMQDYNETLGGDHEAQLRSWLSDIPGVAPLPLSWLLGFSGLYLFVIGPLDWFVLRTLRKQPWTWITFPVTIVVFSTVALVGTALTKGDQAVLSTVEVVDVLPGTGLWRGDASVGVFATGRSDVTLRAGVEDSVAQPLIDPGFVPSPRLSAGLGPGSFAYTAETWTMGYTRLSWIDAAPGGVSLAVEDGAYVVQNDFPFPLEDAQVVYSPNGHLVYPLGLLQPGERRKLPADDTGTLLDDELIDVPSAERGYLSVRDGQLLLVARVADRITPVEVRGVRPTQRDRTILRVPLSIPWDPGERIGVLQVHRPDLPPPSPEDLERMRELNEALMDE